MTFKPISNDTAEVKISRLTEMDKYEIKKSILKAATNSDFKFIRPKELASQLVEAFNYLDNAYELELFNPNLSQGLPIKHE